MYTIILALHVFVCILLIIAVLLQNSKSSDLGAALGGGSGEMFGPKAPSTIMNKITTIIAAAFLVLSLVLAILSGLGEKSIMQGGGSVMQGVESTLPQSSTLPQNNEGSKTDNQQAPLTIPAN